MYGMFSRWLCKVSSVGHNACSLRAGDCATPFLTLLRTAWCECAHVLLRLTVCRHGSKLYIGLPLEQQQRELMACLCEYEGVDYAVLPVMMKDA